MIGPTEPEPEPRPPSLTYPQLFLRFLRFGVLAFGGPVAQIAMIRRELVDEERWISSARFNRLLAVMQALPGPEAHELCVHLGMRAKGRLGGMLAGLGFMLPGFVLMLGMTWLYLALDLQGTALGGAFLGAQVGVVAIVVRAVHRIGEHALTDRRLWAAAAAVAGATALGASFWLTLPAAGLAYALSVLGRERLALAAAAAGVALAAAEVVWSRGEETAAAVAAAAGPATAALLFGSGLKAGLMTFGGAYTAIPFVREDVVERGWMSDGQFLDGLALSSVLPAPLIIFTTFVGYVAGGPAGALAMTVGVFLPAFAFSLIFYDRLEAVVESRRLQGFLAGVTAGVIGLVSVTALQLAGSTAAKLPSVPGGGAIFSASLLLLYLWRSRLAPPGVVLLTGLAGMWLF